MWGSSFVYIDEYNDEEERLEEELFGDGPPTDDEPIPENPKQESKDDEHESQPNIIAEEPNDAGHESQPNVIAEEPNDAGHESQVTRWGCSKCRWSKCGCVQCKAWAKENKKGYYVDPNGHIASPSGSNPGSRVAS